MGWHLAQADWMIHHHSFLRHDVFNYPNLNAPLVNEYPFFQIIVWLVYRLGEYGAALLCSLLLMLPAVLYFREARRQGIPMALVGTSLLVSCILDSIRPALRPELCTGIGTAFFMTFLLSRRHETDWKKFWPLALAQVLWTNSHSGFIIGPALTAGFALEIILRDWIGKKQFSWTLLRCWGAVTLMTSLSCLVNPYGMERIWLPFYHQGSEVIRAYVSEMAPMPFDTGNFFVQAMFFALGLIALACLLYRGGLCWSFLLLTVVFFKGTFISERHIAIFGVMVPGVVLSAGVFGRPLLRGNPPALECLRAVVLFALLMGTVLFIGGMIDPRSVLSPISRWKTFCHNQTQIPRAATAWMRKHEISGRLFHRSEIGGWLQYSGYNHGETYADTGFGKFSEDFIHEIGLSCEDTILLPQFIQKYDPSCVIVASVGYNWPVVLRRIGWRCVFYAPDGTVWLPRGSRPDLPTINDETVAATFKASLLQDSIQSHPVLYYRMLLALQSMGCENLAFEQLMSLPRPWSKTGLFWMTASKLCFDAPPFSQAHIDAIKLLADKPEYQATSLVFRARYEAGRKNWDAVAKLLENLSRDLPNDTAFTLLAEAWVAQGKFEPALALLKQEDLFEMKNARRYQLLALCEEHLGNTAAAAEARKRACYFAPEICKPLATGLPSGG